MEISESDQLIKNRIIYSNPIIIERAIVSRRALGKYKSHFKIGVYNGSKRAWKKRKYFGS